MLDVTEINNKTTQPSIEIDLIEIDPKEVVKFSYIQVEDVLTKIGCGYEVNGTS